MRAIPVLIILAGLLGACATPFPPDTADDVMLVPVNGRIEMTLKPNGAIKEIEFHVRVDAIPAEVRAAADKAMPGGMVLASEKEYIGGVVYWEVTKVIDGHESEVLFDASGKAVTWEVEVPAKDVPDSIRKAADEAAPGDYVKAEKILDGSKKLLEYHVKKNDNGIKYKIVVSLEGKAEAVYRETPAEIEVPLR